MNIIDNFSDIDYFIYKNTLVILILKNIYISDKEFNTLDNFQLET